MSDEKSVRNPFYNGSRIDDIEVNENRGPIGPPGPEGFSPSAKVTQTENGARITVTDRSGTTYADISNGRNGVDGNNGINGFSPLASVEGVEDGAQLTVTDRSGTTTALIRNGERGERGEKGERGETALTFEVGAVTEGEQASVTNSGTDKDIVLDFVIPRGRDGINGFSPLASVTQVEGGAQISVTDSIGTTTALIKDGATGSDGFSPTVEVTETATGHTVTITDKNGWYSFDVENGSDGAAATVQVGNVETLPAGSSAYVVNTGTENAAVFDFGIPKGADGSGGGGDSNFVLVDYNSVTYDVLLDYVSNNKVPYFYFGKKVYVLQYYS